VVSVSTSSSSCRIERALASLPRPFAQVRPGEALTAALMTLMVLLIANVVVFAVLTRAGDRIGVPFFPWVGASAIPLLCVALLFWIGARTTLAVAVPGDGQREEPLAQGRVARVLLRDRYLLLTAGLTLLLNWVCSNGDYLVDRSLLATLAAGKANGTDASVFVTSFKANYFECFRAAHDCASWRRPMAGKATVLLRSEVTGETPLRATASNPQTLLQLWLAARTRSDGRGGV
jgi:hypothetical protein